VNRQREHRRTRATRASNTANACKIYRHLVLPTLDTVVVLFKQLQSTDERSRGNRRDLVHTRLLDEALHLQQHLRVGDLAHDTQGIGAEIVIASRHVFVQAGGDDENYICRWPELLNKQIHHASQALVGTLEQLRAAEKDVLALVCCQHVASRNEPKQAADELHASARVDLGVVERPHLLQHRGFVENFDGGAGAGIVVVFFLADHCAVGEYFGGSGEGKKMQPLLCR
jgi:hypothetical protein